MARGDSTSVALPSGSGFSAGLGEAFNLNLNTGQGVYSLPLAFPQGVAGFSPQLRLEYASAFEHGVFGLGWRLPQREITRSLDIGLPEPGGDSAVRERILDGGTELAAMADGTYRARREAAFTRYERVGDGWRITERSGIRHELGASATARVADPADPRRVYRWLLERSVDLSGNAIEYVYEQDHGTPYLVAIRYAAYTVSLRYAPRPDPRRSGRFGFVSILDRRCEEIAISLAGKPIRSWELAYRVDPLNGASLLASVQSIGHAADGTRSARPAVRFDYATLAGASPSIRWFEGELPPLSDPDAALVTLDDIALPGVLKVVNGRHVYWANRGNLQFAPPRPIAMAPHVNALGSEGVVLADMTGNATADMVVLGGGALHGYYENGGGDRWERFVAYPRARGAEPPFTSGLARTADLDGDGRIDALVGYGRALARYRNHGADGWSGPLLGDGPALDFHDPLVRMADMTGDGLPDLVRIRAGAVEYWPNLGHGRFGERVVLAADLAAARSEELVLADLDGDGVADLARVSAAGVEIWINRGGATLSAPLRFSVIPRPVPGTVQAIDITGRGRNGLVWTSLRAGKHAQVSFELGAALATYRLVAIDFGTGLSAELAYASSVDEALRDRDAGAPWSSHLPFPVMVVSSTRERDAITGRTAEVRYRYHEGHFEPRTRQFEGFARVEKIDMGDESIPDRLAVHTFLARQAEPFLNGLLDRLELFALDGSVDERRPLRIEEADAAVVPVENAADGTPRKLVQVTATRVRHIDRTDVERIDERRFSYDDVGNVIREERRYFASPAAAAPGHVEISEFSYARNDARGIVDRLARVVRRDGDGRLLGELRKYYDGDDFVGLPLGSVERGLETRVERLALDAARIDAHYAGEDPAALGFRDGVDADGARAWFVQSERHAFDARGLRVGDMTASGAITRRTYDAAGLYVETIENSDGLTRMTYDVAAGHPSRVEDPDGTVARLAYDGLGRLLATWLPGDADGAPTRRYRYDDTSVPNAAELSTKLDGTRRTSAIVYFDGSGKELQRRVTMKPGRVIVSAYSPRGAGGFVIREYEPTFADTLAFALPPLADRPVRRFFFDGLGRTIRVVDYDGAIATTTYHPFGVVITDGEGGRREEHYDACNRRVRIVEADGTETRYVPGPLGELTSIVDALGTVATYHGDLVGNRLGVDHRDAGSRRVVRDAAGRVVRLRDGRGHDVTASFDPAGRLTTVAEAGTVVEAYTYGDAGIGKRLTEVRFAGGRDQWRYDARGLVRERVHHVDGIADSFTFAFEHNALGHETRATLPGGKVVDTEYTDNGLVARIPGFVDEIEYDARCLPTRIRYANGVTTDVTYTPGPGRVATQRTTGPGGVLADDSYTFDLLTRLRSAEDHVAGTTLHYHFDPLGQLASVEGAGTIEYRYRGRDVTWLGEIEAELAYGDTAHPGRVTSVARGGGAPAPIRYDADGNIVGLPGRTLAYDFKGQLVRCERDDGGVAEYRYDHRGRRRFKRVVRSGVATETIMLDDRVEVRDGHFAYYITAGAIRVAIVTGAQTRFLHCDHLGSVRFFTDEHGTRIGAIAYHPFGNARDATASPAELRMFALHPFDAEAGLYYMRRRHYAAELGRFVSPDPLYLMEPGDGGDPRTLALYTYCANDPLDYVDPTGLSVWSVIGAIVGAAAGIVMGALLVGAIIAGGWLLIAGIVLAMLAIVAVGYLLAATTSGGVSDFFRGFLIGFAAGVNVTVGAYAGIGVLFMLGVGIDAAVTIGIAIGIALGAINILAAVDTIAHNEVYQGILGWSSWFMPTTWPINGLGLVFYAVNGLLALVTWNSVDALRIEDVQVDWKTGTFYMKGGALSNANPIDTAYNMGHLSFIDRQNPVSIDHVVEHEAGHALSLSAFGSFFHLIGLIDEMGINGKDAFAEQLAEGNVPFPTPGRPRNPMWS